MMEPIAPYKSVSDSIVYHPVSLKVKLLGTGYLIYKHAVDKNDCAQSALSQNYSAEQIRKICR